MTTASGLLSRWNLHRRHPVRGTASLLLRPPFRLRTTTASGHLSPWNLHRRHPARGTVSPLLRAPVRLPMTMASDLLSPWNLHRRHPARGTASLPLHAHSPPRLIEAIYHPCPSGLPLRHYSTHSR